MIRDSGPYRARDEGDCLIDSGGSTMKSLTVFRLDRKTRRKTLIGKVTERRRGERGNNLVGLLRMAKKTFVPLPGDTLQVQDDNLWIEI
jgi:hypothetical protein